MLTGRALTDGRILKFPSAKFPELVQRMPELAQRLVGLMSDRIRETTRWEQQVTGWRAWENFPRGWRMN